MFGNFESAFDPQNLRVLAFLLPILILSMVLHELAHAYVANRLGDPTARMLGRLTPNPLVHLDPMGSIMFVASWVLSSGSFLFGWAKPVPVQPRFFSHPQRGFAIVAIAGPITNILIAYVIALVGIWGLGYSAATFTNPTDFVSRVIVTTFIMNVLLAVFNMLPIPPLDGSRVAAAFMPREMAESWSRLDRYGFVILFGLLVFPATFAILRAIRDPIERLLLTLAGA